jgi:hypothetical protein
MSSVDESENAPDQSSRRSSCPNGWRVISNPTRRPDREADELLKKLIQSIEKERRTPGKRRLDEVDPPEAA